jgi:phosphoglycolate phosphatase
VLATLGRPPLPPETLYRYVGDGARVLVERALGAAEPVQVECGVATFMEFYGVHLLDATRPYPGIENALAALAERGATLSVLTNKPEGLSRAILDGLGLTPRFMAVIGGDSLPVRKPDPAGLELVRSRTGTTRDRVLLVGDSRVDMDTARNAGVAFCGVAWGIVPDALRAARPERIVDHPADIVALACGGRSA